MTNASKVSKCFSPGCPKILLPFVPSIYLTWTSQASNCFVKICLTLIHPKLRAKLCRFVWGQHSRHSWEVQGCFLPRDDTVSYHILSFTFTPKTCGDVMVFRHRNSSVRMSQLHSRLCDWFRFSTCGCSTVAVWRNSCRSSLEVSFQTKTIWISFK